ncbi:8-oxo-dGTP diphosphatase [Anatilimnocola aggregata]|uniref:8-oxo-dGTP diphosphatase n=1 Tax=Anatilimnocola aggregata TaxID=2528021 RepID=A0A517YHX2_9BACT|nr:NUDIX domain-containing protein [Anatilimnocola aggregata]QDU29811.1 8-oxo-dGTP diphosphatase [Anatilimnocola aggregata]
MAQVRLGVVAVVLKPGSSQASFLVIRRSQTVRSPGKFCFPGGSIEAGESEEEAVVREFWEELGARITPQRRLWQSLTITNVRLAWWLVEMLPDQAITPNPLEVESYRWLTSDEALALPDLLASNRDFYAAWWQGDFHLPAER